MSISLVKEKLLNKKKLLALCLLTVVMNNVDISAMKRTPDTNIDPNSSDNQQPLKRPKAITTTTTTASNPESVAITTTQGVRQKKSKMRTPIYRPKKHPKKRLPIPQSECAYPARELLMKKYKRITKIQQQEPKSLMDLNNAQLGIIAIHLALTENPSDENAILNIIKQLCRLKRVNKKFRDLFTNENIAQVLDFERLKAFNLDKTNQLGQSPLWTAINSAYTQAVDILIKAGADKFKADQRGITPVELAIEKNNPDIMTLVVGLNTTPTEFHSIAHYPGIGYQYVEGHEGDDDSSSIDQAIAQMQALDLKYTYMR